MKAKTIVESIGQDFFHYDLIIIRGVPGSGKTTLADMISRYLVSENCPAGLEIVCHHFETDFFFMVDGVYRFNPKLLAENHAKCLSSVANSLQWRPNFGRCITIVANTFTREFEIIKYIEAAKLAGSRVLIIDLYTQYGNVHGVPPEKVNEMSARFVPIPSMNWFTNLGRDEVFHYRSFGAD